MSDDAGRRDGAGDLRGESGHPRVHGGHVPSSRRAFGPKPDRDKKEAAVKPSELAGIGVGFAWGTRKVIAKSLWGFVVQCSACGTKKTMDLEGVEAQRNCRQCVDRAKRGKKRGPNKKKTESRIRPRLGHPIQFSQRQLQRDHDDMRSIRTHLGLPIVYEDYDDSDRPRFRSDCASGPRPCPWVSCRYHLAIDVTADGALRINFDVETAEERGLPTCALDVADAGRKNLDEIGAILGLSRERIRQVEERMLPQLARAFRECGYGEEDVSTNVIGNLAEAELFYGE